MITPTTPRLARGMRDLLPAAARRRRYVTEILRSTFERFGFDPIETPSLETLDTLTGKYGPDADRLIFHAGLGSERDLGLRYDLTVPLARVCASYADELPRPFRRYQIAPLWRGERPQRGRYREFVQADVDIVGSSSLHADAEIILLIVDVLGQLGFENTLTRLNNRKVLAGIGRFSGVATALLPGLFRAIDKLDKVGVEGVRLELAAVGLPGELINRQRQAIDRRLAGKADLDRLRSDLLAALGPDAPAGIASRAVPAFLDALEAEARAGTSDAGAAHDPEWTEAEATAPQSEAFRRIMRAGLAALRKEAPAVELIADEAIERVLEVIGVAGGNDAGGGDAPGDKAADGPAAGRFPAQLSASFARLDGLEAVLDDTGAREGIDELREVLETLDSVELPLDRYAVDLAMVRGLDYYTGTIFETSITDPPIGSITGGGRYDGLVALFGRDLPAVGTSLGVDRLVDALDAQGLFPPEVDAASASVLMARFDGATAAAGFALAGDLRREGLAVELFLDEAGIGDQIRYALKRGMRAVLIIGPDELAAGTVAIRDLEAASQASVPSEEVGARLRALLDPGP